MLLLMVTLPRSTPRDFGARGPGRLHAFYRLVAVLLLAVFPLTAMPAFAKPPKGQKRSKDGQIAVFTFVQGATVEVDGKPIGKTPLAGPVEMTPGPHTLRVFSRGYTEVVEEITVVAGETTEFEADLIAIAGIVRITANALGATVAIDGKAAGEVPFDEDVPAGRHELLIQAPGHKPFTQTVELEGGKAFDLAVTLEVAAAVAVEPIDDDPVYKKWWFWTIIGAVAVGGAVTGIVLGLPEDVTPASDDSLRLP